MSGAGWRGGTRCWHQRIGTPEHPACKDDVGKWHPEDKEGAGVEHCGVDQSPGCSERQAAAPIE